MMRKEAGGVLVLSRGEIERLMSFGDYVEAVEAGFEAAAEGRAVAPPALSLGVEGGAFHAKGAALPLRERLYVAMKINGNFPENRPRRGLPTVQGAIYLADGENGLPLAIMDSIGVTIQRTGAATAVAVRFLARSNARTAFICGAGAQGGVQLRAVKHACPLERAFVFDIDPKAAAILSERMSAELGISVTAVPELAGARDCDVVVTCTSARRAFLGPDHVRSGAFIAAVGADNHDKQEIDPALFPRATVVVDSLEQCAEIGDLHHALAAGTFAREQVHASLAEIVAGQKPGRRSAEEITLFDSTGLGLQDVAAAAVIYERALERGAGTRLPLA